MARGLAAILSIFVCLFLISPTIAFMQEPLNPSYGATSSNSQQYVMMQYKLPDGPNQPFAIATDNLGHVWVVGQESNRLLMFNPHNSSFQEYSIPTPKSTPNSVAVDSSGNVWVTELTSSKLAELKNGSSEIIEYNIPNGTTTLGAQVEQLACGPVAVMVGPNEGVWILCDFSNQIDEFFPKNSTFDRFNLPVWQSGPAGLVFDQDGNFWFTAADANMLGHAVVSELRNGTATGITEFAPLNDTYIFVFQHPTDLQGNTNNITSSLPTPAGIGISPDGKTLWITEHVDGSFDSYNIATKSLDRYWTSKTYGDYGYPYSFPNGLSIAANGVVWMAEHYGNKVAEFDPSTDRLVEYAVPCCGTIASGLYTLTLGENGTVWFVEIFGNAIGELRPVSSPQSFDIGVKNSVVSVGSSRPAKGNVSVAIQYSGFPDNQPGQVKLDISGISTTGALIGATAQFSQSTFNLSGSGTVSTNLSLEIQSLKPGIYDFTVSAIVPSTNTTYSTILKVDASSSKYVQPLVYAAIVGAVASIAAVVVVAFWLKKRKKVVRFRSRRVRAKH